MPATERTRDPEKISKLEVLSLNGTIVAIQENLRYIFLQQTLCFEDENASQMGRFFAIKNQSNPNIFSHFSVLHRRQYRPGFLF